MDLKGEKTLEYMYYYERHHTGLLQGAKDREILQSYGKGEAILVNKPCSCPEAMAWSL